MGTKDHGDLASLLDKLKADNSTERLIQVHREMESRVLKLTDQLNAIIDQRRAKQLKCRKVGGSLKVVSMEVVDEDQNMGQASTMSLPRMRAEESLRPEATYGQMSQMSQLGGGISSATVAGSEAQKVRIQSTIDLQLDKALEEERVGLTYKQVLRRMKDELTVLKKSAEDMRGAVDEFDSAMQQEKLRLRSAMQSRREALSLWQDVQRIREESRNVWLQKIQARERVAENTTKEREALEHSMEERDRSRKRAHLMAKREAQVAAAAKLSEGKVPFHGPGSREAPGVSEEQMVVRELRQAHHQEEMMGGAHGMIANQRTEVHGAVRQRQAAAQHAIETLEGFMREVQVAGLEELFAKLKALEEKGVAAQAQRDKLEAEVLDLQEQVKELGVERDAERLRLEGMPGTGRDVSQGLERQVESATGRLGRSRLALVRAEQSLAQVLMGLRLLTRRIESVIDPGAADPTVDAQTLMRMSSQRPTTKHLDVVPEGSENGAEEPDDEAGQVVEAVREAWQGLEERVKLVLETEWPEAPRDDPRLTEDEVGRVKRRTKTHVGVPGLEGDGQRPRFAPSSRPGSSESQDHVIPERKISTSGGERQKTRSMSFKVEAQRAPSRKEKQDSKTARLLKTRSKLIRSQQQYEAKANVRILADLQSEDEDDEEEEFSAARHNTQKQPRHPTKHGDQVVDRKFLKERSTALALRAARGAKKEEEEDSTPAVSRGR